MIVFLEADCVIQKLVKINFITPKIWKKQTTGTKKYYAIFDHVPTGGKLCFEVHVDNDVHKISAMYIHNLERIHQVNLNAIVNVCKV